MARLEATRVEIQKRATAQEPPPEPVIRLTPTDPLEAFQRAFDQLTVTGGMLLLAPGPYRVNGRRSAANGDKRVVVTSDTTDIPAVGQRITKDHRPGLAELRSADALSPAFHVLPGARGETQFVGVAFGPQSPASTVFRCGGDRREMATPEQRPRGVHLDRVLFMGDPVTGQHRAFEPNCLDWSLVGCAAYDFFEIGRDSQCVMAWNGCERGFIDNCEFEASAENVLFGGADSAGPLMDPREVVIRNTRMFKTPAWRNLPTPPVVKTLFEIKNLRGLLMENCLLERNWAANWPTGDALTLKCANQDGANTTAAAADIVIRNIVARDCGVPIVIVAHQDGGKNKTERMANVRIENCLFYRIAMEELSATRQAWRMANAPTDLVLDHLTWHTNGHSFLHAWTDDGALPGRLTYTNNVVAASEYGAAVSGWSSFDVLFPPAQRRIAGNAVRSGARDPRIDGLHYIPKPQWDASFDLQHRIRPDSAIAAVPTTDGKAAGCDVDALLAAMPWLTLQEQTDLQRRR